MNASKKQKILFLTYDQEDRYNIGNHHFKLEVASRFAEAYYFGPGYVGYREPVDIGPIIEGIDPDVLFIMLPGKDFKRETGLIRAKYRRYKCKKVLYDTDSQINIWSRCKFINRNEIDHLLLGNNFKFIGDHERLIDVPCKVWWQPFGVNVRFFANRMASRPKHLMFLGNIRWRNYPDRTIMVNTMRRVFGEEFFFRATNKITHIEYTQLLNKIRIFVSAGDIDKGFFMKYLEAMSSGCLLISQWSPCFERLGFVSGEHLFLYDSFEEMVDLARYYLDHDKERGEIAFRGSRFVAENHTWKHRVDELMERIL